MLILPLGPEEEDLGDTVVDRPWVTWGLAALCLLVHLLVAVRTSPQDLFGTWMKWGYRPDLKLGFSLVTYQFLHGDFWHLLGNAIFLVAFGTAVEKKLGHLSTGLVFLFSGIVAALFWGQTVMPKVIEVGGSRIRYFAPLIGASGAVSGLIGCLLPSVPTMRIRVLVGLRHYWKVVPIQAWLVTILYFAKEILLSVIFTGGSVAYGAHIGGVLGGAFVGALLLPLMARAWQSLTSSMASRPVPGRRDLPSPASPSRRVVEEAEPIPSDPERTLPPVASEVLAPRLGRVPQEQDWQDVSGEWSRSWDTADLQRRFHKARAVEKDPERGASAFRFYQRVLKDRRIPGGHRAYAGTRLCAMLFRMGRFTDCLALAERLLSASLPPHIAEHLEAVAEKARGRLASS